MVQFKVKIDISNIQFTKTKMSKIMQKRATLIIIHYITFCESKNMLLKNCSCKCETNFISAIREISLLKELVHPNIVRLQVGYF